MVTPRRTFCRICEAACGLVTTHGADGELIGLRPDKDHPVSRGYVCAKGTRFVDVARHPSRLAHPELGGASASWPEAIGAAAQRLRDVVDRHGPHAVGIYFGNPMAFNALGIAATLAFARALGTRNLFYAGSQDCNNKFAASRLLYGSEVMHPFPDFGNTDLAIVFGSNPYVSQSSFVHLEGGSARVFDGIEQRGGSIVWVDPRRTESAQRWGEHVPIVPGTDAWLLLGLLGLIGDRGRAADGLGDLITAAKAIDPAVVQARTGIQTSTVERLAQRLIDAPTAALHMSVGVNQGGHGTLASVALQALAYVTGNLDAHGGLLFSPLADSIDRVFRIAGLHRRRRSRIGGFGSTLSTLPAGILADEILTPGPDQIRALLVIAGDPLRSIPGATRLAEALPQLSFLAGIDMFRNTTTARADVMLPAASWLERWDVAIPSLPFQRTPLMQVAGPVAPRFGEAKTDAQILSELALALRLPGQVRWRLGARCLDRWLPAPRHGVRGPVQRPGRFLRRHHIQFWGPELADAVARLHAAPPAGNELRLLGRRRRLGHNSWLHGAARDGDGEAVAWMRVDDMQALGLEDGDEIDVAGPGGTLRLPVVAREGLARGTVVVPHGVPGHNINAVLAAGPANIEPESGMLTMTGIAAEVRPARSADRNRHVSN